MNTINRQELKSRLVQEGYVEANGVERTLDNLLNLKGEAAKMLLNWFKDGETPEFEMIEGIDSLYLREILKMKDPAIILSYGMLLNDPKRNSAFLKNIKKYHMGHEKNKM